MIAIPFHHTMYRQAKSVERCQCCQQRVALSYPHSAADFFRYNVSPKVINSSDNASCFHSISFSFTDS